MYGTPGDNGPGTLFGTGAAHVFEHGSGGPNRCTQLAKLTASDAREYDNFGLSVAASADTVVVGGGWTPVTGDYSGAEYIYKRHSGGPDAWDEVAKVTVADPPPGAPFGRALSLSSGTLVTGGAHITWVHYLAIFADGFESGDMSAWSAVVP